VLQGRNEKIAAGFALALVITIVLYWVDRGLGQPSVPKDDVARVGDVFIPIGKQEGPGIELGKPFGTKGGGKGPPAEADAPKNGIGDFNHALVQAAIRQGLKTIPKPGTTQYKALRDQAMGDLLDAAWIQGEASDRGITVTDSKVQEQLAQIKKQNFPTKAAFDRFLKRSGFTPYDVEQRVRLQLLSQEIQKRIVKNVEPVSGRDVGKYYEANKVQFEQPASRDARLILNKSKAKIDAARSALETSTSEATFKRVAKQYSTDVTTKDAGGLRQNIVQGTTGDPQLDAVVFTSSKDTVIGPVKTSAGYYLVDVIKVTPKHTQPQKSVSAQIKQQLTSQRQQEAFSGFIEDYRAKWTEKTICAKGYIFERCGNAAPAVQRQKGAPAVTSTRPAAPGHLAGFGQPLSAGMPQGPHPAGADKPPLPPGGIPGLPPGVSAPPGAGAPPPGASGGPPPGASGGPPPGASGGPPPGAGGP
jgi:parvulin-like peptidyl-prolyl isomerase